MKRRVLRAHANKHNLRIISSANKLTLDAYHVLCDASFLRAALLSYVKHERDTSRSKDGNNTNSNNNNNNNNSSNNNSNSAFTFMKSCVEEAFGGAGPKQPSQHLDAHGRGGEEDSRRTPQRLHYYCLPETAAALERLLVGGAKHSDKSSPRPPADGGSAKAPTLTRQQERANRHMRSAAKDLLAKLQKVPSSGADRSSGGGPPRNEAKTIAEFLVSHQRRTQDPSAVSSSATIVRNAHHYFVATQSHDVRKLLPPHAALLRWSAQPDCVWVEVNGDTYHYNNNSSGANSNQQPQHRALGQKQLSAADVAFMKHLGKAPAVAAVAKGNRHSELPVAAAAAAPPPPGMGAKQPPLDGAVTAASDDAAQQRKRARRHSHQPNPLSMKKKSRREVFRCDE